ncbi:MAG TPA: Dabb family protein [Opitutaceae bacterium]|nr:Dabb family protein [Opitutaceae bacterium]
MLIHSVYFWLRPDVSPAQRSEFRQALQGLEKIPAVEKVHVGAPAATERSSHVDHTFTFALTVFFRDVAAHDAYQVDPLHWAFVNAHEKLWTKVVVFDSA